DDPGRVPTAAKHRNSDHLFQEHCRKNRLYRIAGAEARLPDRICMGRRACCQLHFTALARTRDRLGSDTGARDHLPLGAVGADRRRPRPHSQDRQSPEPARYQAGSRPMRLAYLMEIDSGTFFEVSVDWRSAKSPGPDMSGTDWTGATHPRAPPRALDEH